MGILEVIAAITNLITEVIKSQPPEVSAELWKLHLKDVQAFRAFFENMLPKTTGRLSYEDELDPLFPPDPPPLKRKKGKKR